MTLTRRALLAGGIALALSGVAAQASQPSEAARGLPRIAVLATGGTIASTGTSATQVVGYRVTEGVSALLAAIPDLAAIASISSEQVANVASGNITNEHLLTLAARLNALLARPDIDGAVVTHGTDTLEETAFFLNLTVRSAKPLVITGAMRPGSAMSADGPMNLFNAVLLAGTPEARGKGVLVMLNDRIGAARHTTKTHTTGLDTFRSGEQGFLGSITAGRAHFYGAPLRRHTVASEFDVTGMTSLPRVDIVYEYQGASGDRYDAAEKLGAQGIVVAAVGSGGLSTVSDTAARAVAGRGVIVVKSSRTGSGIIPKRARDAATGLVSADSLNPQMARILLVLALTRTTDPARIQAYFDAY